MANGQPNKVSKSSTIILGIDPGLANTGWGVIEQRGSAYRCRAYGCLTTAAHEETAARLAAIHDGILLVIRKYHPSELGIETVYFGANSKSAFATGQARGAALVACAAEQLIVGEYSPRQIKYALVGTGSAEKEQVQYMVRAVLALDHEPSPDHAADALAAAICHGNLRGMRLLDQGDACITAQQRSRAGTGCIQLQQTTGGETTR